MNLVDPYEALLIGSGYALDAVGSIKGIDLPRNGVEPDDIYRSRLISKWVLFLTPEVATGEYLDRWMMDHEWRGPMGTEITALADEPKPNHVRDAVRANQ
jgi:hypothetical protein